ncbi:MAG: AmmeMemoRadiSam system protein B, partial [Candidatus Micrarchaeaceae archaeon]
MVRKSAVDGEFYPGNAIALDNFITKSIAAAKLEGNYSGAFSYIAPHAGYEYSGSTAAYTYKALSQKSDNLTAIIIGPNH